MERLQYLRDQVSRAERLARTMTDGLTVERLQLFAADCRREIDLIGSDLGQAKAQSAARLSHRFATPRTNEADCSQQRQSLPFRY